MNHWQILNAMEGSMEEWKRENEHQRMYKEAEILWHQSLERGLHEYHDQTQPSIRLETSTTCASFISVEESLSRGKLSRQG
ncbi:unnamed protein product [Leuciscus chuanchicus]